MPIKILEGLKILCVDDSEDALFLLTTVLNHHGAETTACLSAEAALVNINIAKFDVIVSDLSMPGMDGYDLVHALRKIEKTDGCLATPTLAVSGNADSQSAKRRFGDFQVYMTKPFNLKNLVNVVERLAEADGGSVDAGSLATWDRNVAFDAESKRLKTLYVSSIIESSRHPSLEPIGP